MKNVFFHNKITLTPGKGLTEPCIPPNQEPPMHQQVEVVEAGVIQFNLGSTVAAPQSPQGCPPQ